MKIEIEFAVQDFTKITTRESTPTALGLMATAFREASIRLNNDAISLPESDWRAVREQCDALSKLSKAYALASVPINV